jgi:uncharacterized protein YkwD
MLLESHGWSAAEGKSGAGPRWLLGRAAIALAASVCLWLVPASLAPSLAQAETCSTKNPTTNATAPDGEWNTEAEIEANFTAARKAEGCNTALKLPTSFNTMSAQQQTLFLFDNEREVRGLGDLKLDSTLMSQISLNHSNEMAQYGYQNHPSPINQPQSVFARMTVNPALAPNQGLGEIIAWGYSSAAQAVFAWMYQDSESAWGHRENILTTLSNPWVGIGIVQNAAGSSFSNYYTGDFASLENYTPPATADTHGPEIGTVSYSAGTATATGVKDSPLNKNDTGEKPFAAGVTGVVFYANKIVESPEGSGTFDTVSATESPKGSGTWSAKITVGAGETLHAVAVDPHRGHPSDRDRGRTEHRSHHGRDAGEDQGHRFPQRRHGQDRHRSHGGERGQRNGNHGHHRTHNPGRGRRSDRHRPHERRLQRRSQVHLHRHLHPNRGDLGGPRRARRL